MSAALAAANMRLTFVTVIDPPSICSILLALQCADLVRVAADLI